MKLRNKLIKQFAINEQLKMKNRLYSSYSGYDTNKICYVLTDETDIVICNIEHLNNYKEAGFSIFGIANNEQELANLIEQAEQS
jgi:hypothetical protein